MTLKVSKPWGSFEVIQEGNKYTIKKIIVKPGGKLSLQSHNYRSEHWSISSGKAKISINKKKYIKGKDDTAFIPKGSLHRIENPYSKPVVIMEAQTGEILKETDIIRYKDIYGRVR